MKITFKLQNKIDQKLKNTLKINYDTDKKVKTHLKNLWYRPANAKLQYNIDKKGKIT